MARSLNRRYRKRDDNYRININFPCIYSAEEDPYQVLEASGALEYFKPQSMGRGSIRWVIEDWGDGTYEIHWTFTK